MDGNAIKVVCRFRPQNDIELQQGGKIVVRLDEEVTDEAATLHLESETQKGSFAFDKIFDWSSTQKHVYDYAVAPTIDDLMKGYNGTVFAYGQTGSGKTFTMMGKTEDDVLKGVIPRIVEDIFRHIHDAPNQIEFTVKVSYLEIYLEKIRDLLAPQNDNLPIHEDKSKGTYIKGMKEVYVSNVEEILEVMRSGDGTRAVSSTNMNEQSSRSHSLFMINVYQKNTIEGTTKSGTLYLVDLAGSEKIGKTGATGQTLEEAKKINKSLSALGMVINALTDGKSAHIPYRDSKLTRILQESLGGNSKTTLIINCSPSSYNDAETLSTLRFGYRAKNIKNKAKQNLELSASQLKVVLKTAETELRQLKRKCKGIETELLRWRAGEKVAESDWYEDSKTLTASSSQEDVSEELKPELKRSQSSQLLTEEKELLLTKEAELLDLIQEKEHEIEKLTKKCQDTEYYEAEIANLMEENKKWMLASTTQKATTEKLDFDYKSALIKIEALEAEQEALQVQAALSQERSSPVRANAPRRGHISDERSVTSPGSDIALSPTSKMLQKYQRPVPQQLTSYIDALFQANESISKENLVAKIRASTQSMASPSLEQKDGEEEVILYDSPFEVPKDVSSKSPAEAASLMTQQAKAFEKMRRAFMEDLQDRCERVVELQMHLDTSQQQLSALAAENGHQSLLDQIVPLDSQVENLSHSQHELQQENMQLKRDVQTRQRQALAANERATNLESLIQELNANMASQMRRLEAQVDQLKEQVQKSAMAPQFSFGDGKVAKPLRGKDVPQ